MKRERKQGIAWVLVWALLVLCVVPESGVVQAAEGGVSEDIEENKVQLDANNKDSQGILYTLDATTCTAMVGAELDEVDENTSEYAGANGGMVVLPEIVEKDDVEYTVTSVAYGAFWGNTEIQSVALSDTITTLGQKSFYGSSVKSLVIGAGLESMDAYALGRMANLETITVDEANYSYSVKDGILYNWSKTELVKYPATRTDPSFVVPDGVYTIGDSAFSLAPISGITMPKTVRLIGNEAFFQTNLTKANLKYVLEIGDYAFSECSQLRWARLRDWVVLGEGAFADNEAMQAVYIPKYAQAKETNVTGAFQKVSNLKCLVVEEGAYFSQIKATDRYNFERCTSLETVILEEGVSKIPNYFLYKSNNLSKIYVPSSISVSSDGYALKETGAQICALAESAVGTYLDQYSLDYTDITEHTHTFTEKVYYTDDEIEIKGQYCEQCGYGTKNSFVVKGEISEEEEVVTYELDDENKDEQEILYTLDSSTKTAMVGSDSSNMGGNTSNYQGLNDGVVTIPDQVMQEDTVYKVTKIGKTAFSSNARVESVDIPQDVNMESPGSSFSGNSLLETIIMNENNPYYQSLEGVLYSRDQSILCKYPCGRGRSSYTIEDGTRTIGSSAIASEKSLQELILPKSVVRIKYRGIALTNILFLDLRGIKEFEEYSVYCNDDLRNIVLGENASVSSYAFYDSYTLRAVYLPRNAKINEAAFMNCGSLQLVVMEQGCQLFGQKIFANGSLEKVILPEDLSEIPEECFADDATSLEKLYIPENVTEIAPGFLRRAETVLYGKAGSAAASFENFVDITDHEHDLQDTVLYESDYIRITAKFCEECHYGTDCEQVVLSDPEPTSTALPTATPSATPQVETGVNEQGEYVFSLDDEYRDAQGIHYKTYKMTDTTGMAFVGNDSSPYACGYEGANDGHVIIPDKVVKDGIEYTVTRLEQTCFASNEYIVSIRLPKSIKNMNSRALYNCKNLKSIEVDEDNPYFLSEDGVLFTKDKTTLLTYPGGKTGSYDVPAGVQTIDKEACYGATFENISFPDTVEVVGQNAFMNATIPYLDLRNVEIIGQQAFCNVSGLETILLKEGSQIVYGGFWGCDDLTCVYISEHVTIGKYAFYDCKNLQSVVICSGSVIDGECAFSNCAKLETVILPEGLTTLPEKTFTFTTMDQLYLPQTVTEVGYASILTSTVAYAYPDVDTTNINQYVDVSSHTHELENKVFCENSYVRIQGEYCPVCGYAKNCTQTILLAAGEVTPPPTASPTSVPSATPTEHPLSTVEPTIMPVAPTSTPTAPTETTKAPVVTFLPTIQPTMLPTMTASPTESPEASSPAVAVPSVTPQASEIPVETPTSSPVPDMPISSMLPAPGATEGVMDPIMSPIIIERYYEKEYVVGAVGGFKVSTTDNKTIRLSWQSVSGATGYAVYRATKKNGSYKLLKAVGTAVSYLDKSVKTGKTYYYKIRVTNGLDSEVRAFSVNGMTAPKVVVKKRKAGSNKYLDIRIKRYKGKFAQIQVRKGKGKFKTLKLRYKRIKKYKGRFKLLYLNKNKWLSIRVRTYKKKGKKKIYSKYSKVVKVRV